ncbi:MAG: 3-deoxy-D-manno-octulosonic acid transferase [Bacteroidales bacterium]|nr:3-deoxy-D-manno-octulosonic acid transferase [Bacteroidales bacterium]
MRLLYSIGIYAYLLGVRVASLFNVKARQMVRGWRESHVRLWQFVKDLQGTPVAWFHAASLGEFEQARPVLEKFRMLHPSYKILLTFFSPSGYEVRKKYDKADLVCYLPMDTPGNAFRLVQTVCPRVAFFVKYDFWFNYLSRLRRIGCRTYIFSAIFRPSHYFFKPYGKWFLRQLRQCFALIFVQNQQSLDLLRSHGIDNSLLAGDTRFDRVNDIAQRAPRFEEIESFIGNNSDGLPQRVLMAGSSWEPDEQHLKRYFDHRGGRLKMILAPHVISETHIASIISLFGQEYCVRYSQLKTSAAAYADRQVLIIDNIGMLSSLYRYAHVAYIGGGWGRGIHNTLEAVTFGKPVVFGPNHRKFQEAQDLLSLGGGFDYSDYDTLQKVLDSLFDDDDAYNRSSQTCTDYLHRNLGSSDLIIGNIKL